MLGVAKSEWIKMNYIIASVGEWNKDAFAKCSVQIPGNWYFCDTPESLNVLLTKVQPRYIFFPHWRWIVPKSILENHECICFHMTDVPYGRGGSPLQNLIFRGHKDTVLTALRMEEELDSGPVYFKKQLSLDGTAEEIYKRAADLSWKMIEDFVQNEPSAVLQSGKVVTFKRRKPEQSAIPSDLIVEQIYDYIRMLDAPGYPYAFIEASGYRFEFTKAELKNGELTANVKLTIKDK